MSGWKTTKDVIDLRDEVIAKLDSASPDVRRHAWYWISFHVNAEHDIEDSVSGTAIDDKTIEWLRKHPERFNQHKDMKAQLVSSLEKQLEQARRDLEKLS